MRNLTKNLSLLIAIFSLILISSISAGKTSAQQNSKCSITFDWKDQVDAQTDFLTHPPYEVTAKHANSPRTLIGLHIQGTNVPFFDIPSGLYEAVITDSRSPRSFRQFKEATCPPIPPPAPPAPLPPARENEFCFKTSDCLSGLICAIADPDLGFGGTCQKSPPPPAPIPSNSCKEDSDCQSGFACVDKCTDLGPAGLDCRGVCEKKEPPPAPPPAPPPTARLVWKNIATCPVPTADACDSDHGFACPTGKTCKNIQDTSTISSPGGDATVSVGKCEKDTASTQPSSEKPKCTASPFCSGSCVVKSGFNNTCTKNGTRGNCKFQAKDGQFSTCDPAPAPDITCDVFNCLDSKSSCVDGSCKPPSAQPPDPSPSALPTSSPSSNICNSDDNFACPAGKTCKNLQSTGTISKLNKDLTILVGTCEKDTSSSAQPAVSPAGQSTVSITDCPINQTGGGITFKCRASNPDPNSCIKQLATTCVNITAATDTCWQCTLPATAPPPTTACSPGDCSGLCAVGSSCQQVAGTFTKSCTCQSTTASTSTPAQTTTTLAVTLNAQDTVLASETLPVTLSLFNLSTNTLVQGAPAASVFNKTPIPGKQFAANIPISGSLQNKFFLLIRKDNLIARTFFTIDSSGSITVPTTTLVFGDINNDNDINILDFNILIGCFGKLASATGCSASDFDSNGKINAIDFNTWLRGLATWKKQI